jgi:O-6-methylguanine DNA methyltransferase
MMTETLFRSDINTPVGRMIVITSEKGLCFLEYDKENRSRLLEKRLQTHFFNSRLDDGENDMSDLARSWLNTYFKESCHPDILLPLDTRGTGFEKKVWHALQAIPFGTTASYKEVAVKIGSPGGARAVGGASRRNPVSVIVPCHRVVGSSGGLTGYGGGLDAKQFLLKHESAG